MRRITIASIVFVIVVNGCERKLPPSSTSAPTAVHVDVINDPDQVAELRRDHSAKHEKIIVETLSHPEAIRGFEEETLALLRSQRSRSVKALETLRDDAALPPATRLHASVALNLLGEPVLPEKLAELASKDASARLELLLRLSDLYPSDQGPIPSSIRQVIVEAVDDADPRTFQLAASLCAYRGYDEAGDKVVAKLKSAQGADSGRLLNAAASLRPTPEIVERLVSSLRKDKTPFGTPDALSGLAEVVNTTAQH